MKQLIRVCLLSAGTLLAAYRVPGDQTDDYIRNQMASHRIPGLALMVICDGKEVKNSTYGQANLELSVPVKQGTVFEIGSITKQFTSVGILLLVQEGKLSVNDKISAHLKGAAENWANITIRHLLTHTSGLKSYTGLDGFALTKHLSQEQFIKAIGNFPLEFEPGSSWKYCNTGFNLLGFIIENISGQSYWDYTRERILKPLGMSQTADRQPGAIIPNRASGYEQTNQVLVNRDYDLTDVFAAGAIASTLQDLAKWNAALDSDKLLKPELKVQMWTPTKLNDGSTTKYGFGWFIDSVEGHRNIGHGGSTSGFSASIQKFPDDHLTVLLLTNTDEQIASSLARKVASFHLGVSQ
jgi:CubicO group peptidase (beta-lactamase class C family)